MPNPNIITITITFLFLFLLLNLVSAAPQVPCFFIFGDSLVDNGNNNILNTTAKVNYLPYGIDFPAGPTGRFSNGRNIADVIAEKLGFEKSVPPFANATDEDLLLGVNYGSGGSGILDDSGSIFGDISTLNEQLSNHEAAISRLEKKLGNKKATEKHLKSCLYYAGLGNNDYLGNYLPKFYAGAATFTPEQFAAFAIEQYSKQLQKLYNYGARKIAVVAVGQIGCIPQQLFMYGTDSSPCVEASNDAVLIFNGMLQRLVKTLNSQLPDAKFLYTAEASDNISFGNIKVVTEPCCQVSEERLGHCVEGGEICKNRDEYYFWDWYHPSDAAVSFSGANLYRAMSPLYTNLVDVL